MNKFIGMGRHTQTPELKTTTSGIPVCSFTLAVDRRFKTADGERKADFLNFVAWRKDAEFVTSYFEKGKMMGVEGTLQTRSWEDADGNKRYATEIIVENVYFCGDSNKNDGDNNQPKQASTVKQQLQSEADYEDTDDEELPIF